MYKTTISLQSDQNQKLLAIHIMTFVAFWTVYEVFISPYIKGQCDFLFNLLNPIVKLLTWTLPVLVTLYVKGKNIFSYLKLNNNMRFAIVWSVIASLFIISYNLLMEYVFYGKFKINPYFDVNKWISSVLLIGFTEEILFRGYFLQELQHYFEFKVANFYTSLLFLVIHFPIWYAQSSQIANGLMEWIFLMTFVFWFSIVQGYLFKQSHSLWPCITMHMINNFLVSAIIAVK